VLRQAGIRFEEMRIPRYRPESTAALATWSPSGKVPALHDGDIRVWDSLAICETFNERFPDKQLWPADAVARAVARSVSAEMHAGFAALREHISTNIRGRYPGKGRTPACLADIERIVAIWTDCRARFGAGGARPEAGHPRRFRHLVPAPPRARAEPAGPFVVFGARDFPTLRDYYEIVFSRHGWRTRLKACNVECKI